MPLPDPPTIAVVEPALTLKDILFIDKIIYKESPSLEAQVAAISDDIAYNNHDLQDGLRADLFSIEKVGEKLRTLMPWIAEGKMVDKSKN